MACGVSAVVALDSGAVEEGDYSMSPEQIVIACSCLFVGFVLGYFTPPRRGRR